MTGSGGGMGAWLWAAGLLSLRIAPVFAFAPPFTLVRMPMLFRMLFGIAIAAMVASYGAAPLADGASLSSGVSAMAGELMIAAVFIAAFQIAFGALYMAGRTIDVQAGFGLALLVDPSSRNQTPLIGTIFALLAGAIFFEMNGHHDLLRLVVASTQSLPLGGGFVPTSLAGLAAFLSIAFLISFGAAGGVIVALFLTDLTIAVLARTAPQMNALVIGFQVKVLVLLIALPATLGLTAALIARLMALTLEAIPGLFR